MTSVLGGAVVTRTGPMTVDLHIEDGLFTAEPGSQDVIDAEGLTVAAGFIDTHVHGALGNDFTNDPETIWTVGRWLPSTGVTSFVPSIVTAPYDTYTRAIEVMHAGPPDGYSGADAVGLHFEGPWISPDWKGAHRTDLLRVPDVEVAESWAESGLVKIVTIAPELPDAGAAAQVLAEAGVVISLGHSGASYDEATTALAGSWSTVTHLFNQMSGFGHRSPGVVAAALNSMATCELIVDGLHSEPGALQLAWQILGADRTVLMTDAMQATGLGPGTYWLGDLEVTVTASGPRLADGRLASSILTMDQAVSNLVNWTSASLADAITAATATPAKRLGLSDRGTIESGRRADLVILDETGSVASTIVAGQTVFSRD